MGLAFGGGRTASSMLDRILPRSIVVRVLTLYTIAWLLCIGGVTWFFFRHEFAQQVDGAHETALIMIEMTAQTVSDSAVIGDYDTIKRLLDTAAQETSIGEIQFIDLSGGRLRSAHVRPLGDGLLAGPWFLVDAIAAELQDLNRSITVGGMDYGILRMRFDSVRIAAELWTICVRAVLVGAVCFLGGLLLIWVPLHAWLQRLGQSRLVGGALAASPMPELDPDLVSNAPAEFRQTLAALSVTGQRLRGELAEREAALASLRKIIADMMPDASSAPGRERDIGAMVATISRLVQEREATRQELERAKQVSESANDAKSAFLATMSHELRTPMNGILGMAQLLEAGDLDEAERRRFVRTIAESGTTLLELLNDILDFSKIEAGKVQIVEADAPLRQLLDGTVSLFAETARGKGVTIRVSASGPADRVYRSDPLRLRQMLSNLVSNAVKFTDRGEIRIEVAESVDPQGKTWLEVSVADTGIGIPAEKQSLLFDRFSQVDASMSRRHGGSGLGLSIVRGVAHAMGGTVGMSSRSGEGSRFWFRVPVGIAVPSVPAMPTGVAAAADRGALFAGRVLVADDTPANRLVTERLLARLGVTVAAVEDGRGAVDGATGPLRPDLVFMDLQMPDMDGLEATRRIRAWEALGGAPRIPVVALTAAAFDTDRQRCMDAGMDGYIAKPVMLANLRAELARWLPRRIPPAGPAAAAALSSPAAGRG